LRPAANGRAASLIEGWAGGLEEYGPENVEKITGVRHERLERLARELADQSPAVAIVGGPALAHTNGLFTALAVNALNELLGTVGQPGGVHFTPGISVVPQSPSPQSLQDLASAKVVLLDGANPVFGMPKASKIREALDK